MDLKSITATMSEKGAAYVLNERNRLRAAFMQGRALGKVTAWLPTDDAALDAFDTIVMNMARDAGLVAPPMPAPFTLDNAPADLFEAEAARRGMSLVPHGRNRPAVPQQPAPAPRDLDETGKPADDPSVEDQISRLVSGKGKPPSFA